MSVQLIALSERPEDDYEYPKPGKSTILFELLEEPSYQFTRWDEAQKKHVEVGLMIDEIQHEGGSAAIEAEQGMLEDAVYDLLDPADVGPGWWVIDGFYGTFCKGDGWMTDDEVDFECNEIRPARWSDMKHFGVQHPPIWARIAMWLGLDPLV